MLRKRIVTVLTFNDGVLFRTKLFEPDYRYTLNFVDAWSVDEIVILDVTRPGQGSKSNFFSVIRQFAGNCFVPLSAGGGIREFGDVRQYLAVGADKVVVNTGALQRPELIREIAEAYGSQCVVVSIDARKTDNGYEVFSGFAGTPTGMSPVEWAQQAEELGAGEILITSVRVVKVRGDWCKESGGQGIIWMWFPGRSVVSGYLMVITLELEKKENRFMTVL